MYGSINNNQNQQANNPWLKIGSSGQNQNSGSFSVNTNRNQNIGSNSNSRFRFDPILCLQILFPDYNLHCFTTYNIILCWIIFIITKIVYKYQEYNYPCILYSFGANYGPDLTYRYQLQRLVLPLWLHANFFHIFFNCIGLLAFGFSSEIYFGKFKFIFLYILSGIGGNLLSSYFNPYSLAVGASTGLFGLCALRIFYVIENYHSLGESKKAIIYVTLLISLSNLINSFDNQNIDMWGHIGGFIVGVLFSFGIYKNDSIKIRLLQKFGILILISIIIYGFYNILTRDIYNIIFNEGFNCDKEQQNVSSDI